MAFNPFHASFRSLCSVASWKLGSAPSSALASYTCRSKGRSSMCLSCQRQAVHRARQCSSGLQYSPAQRRRGQQQVKATNSRQVHWRNNSTWLAHLVPLVGGGVQVGRRKVLQDREGTGRGRLDRVSMMVYAKCDMEGAAAVLQQASAPSLPQKPKQTHPHPAHCSCAASEQESQVAPATAAGTRRPSRRCGCRSCPGARGGWTCTGLQKEVKVEVCSNQGRRRGAACVLRGVATQ